MLTAIVFWTAGAWHYRVADAGLVLEQGTLTAAQPEGSSALLVYLLRHRWPQLPSDACAAFDGPAHVLAVLAVPPGGCSLRP